MKPQNHRLFIFVAFLVIASLACGLGAAAPAAAPPPPQSATSVPIATSEPPTGTPVPAFELGTEYTHPSGLFTLTPPKDWKLTESAYGLVIESPDQTAYIGITVTNTIHSLTQDELKNFITANEENRFSSYNQYKQTRSDMNLDKGSAVIGKTLMDENGVPQAVLTNYWQDGQAVYVMHQWANASNPDTSKAFFDQYAKVSDSFKHDASTVAKYPPYPWTFHITGPNDVYEIDIPQPWTHTHTVDKNTSGETFLAPDQNAGIQIITYDDGKTTMTQFIAGKVALLVLNQSYTNGAGDIKVTSDKSGQAKGTERLDWKSKTGGYQGVTFFHGHGTTLTLLTFVFNNGFENDYQYLVDYTIGTYVLP